MRILLLYIVLCCWWNPTAAQFFSSRFEQPIPQPVFLYQTSDSTKIRAINEDSLIAAKLSPVDTTIPNPKSTTVAMLASMLAPGFGQIYNESYWKAPIIWGYGYYFVSVYRDQDKHYKEEKRIYENLLDQFEAAKTAGNKSAADSIFSIATDRKSRLRDFYRNQRDEFGWYIVITYLINILDAYVDAALYNFEVSPNLQGTNDYRATIRIPILSPTNNKPRGAI